jgi:hypothetical protein
MSKPATDLTVPTVINVGTVAYAPSKCLGGLQTIAVLDSPLQPGGILNEVDVYFQGGNTLGVTVYLFGQNPTNSVIQDGTLITIAAADVSKLALPPFTLTPSVPQGVTFSAASQPLAKSITNRDNAPATNIYAAIVANSSITPAGTADLILGLSVLRDGY